MKERPLLLTMAMDAIVAALRGLGLHGGIRVDRRTRDGERVWVIQVTIPEEPMDERTRRKMEEQRR